MGLTRVMTRYVDRNASYLFATALDAHSSQTSLNQRPLFASSWPTSNDRNGAAKQPRQDALGQEVLDPPEFGELWMGPALSDYRRRPTSPSVLRLVVILRRQGRIPFAALISLIMAAISK